eukprot:6176344-Pleurochrysis_carterae.AAC.4
MRAFATLASWAAANKASRPARRYQAQNGMTRHLDVRQKSAEPTAHELNQRGLVRSTAARNQHAVAACALACMAAPKYMSPVFAHTAY